MPLYEYRCGSCGARVERIQKFSDPPLAVCPACGGALEKLVSSPAFHLKGTGWYATDYAKKTEKADQPGSGDGGSEAKDDVAKSDAPKADAAKSDTPKGESAKAEPASGTDKAAAPKDTGAASKTDK